MANSKGDSYVEPTHNVESGDDRDTGLDPDSRRAGVRGRCRDRETRRSSPMSQPLGRKRDRHYGDRSSLSDDRGKVRYYRFKCSRSLSHSKDVSDRSRSRSKDRSVSRGLSVDESSYSYARHSSEDDSSNSSRRSSRLSPPRKRNSSDSRSNYVGFEVADPESEKPELPSDMTNYVMNKFTAFIPEKILMDNILDKYPVPKNISVGAHKVNSYVPEFFQSVNRSYAVSRESREISKELAAKSKSSHDCSRSTNTQRDQAKPDNKPFQKKAPFRGGRSGGRSNSFRGRTGAQKIGLLPSLRVNKNLDAIPQTL
ncbi:uncharacterized protein DDB_G0287625-like [Argopecten irradians]|uniref:uncharacterized protein DDB_G0287625-like n=1 Tax=Argopecten irradians TaxID=31199 RepID=UPI003722CEAE